MTATLFLAIAWVFASTIVAFLPMRRQYLPGGALLLAAPVLIVMIGINFGWIAAIAAVLAFLSMFRNPLRYLWKKWRGLPVEVPE